MNSRLPPWLSDWNGAAEIVKSIDSDELKLIAQSLIDLVLAEDGVFLDSLPEDLESDLISPMETLAQVYENDGPLTELVVACRLVRRSASPYLSRAPGEFKYLIESLPE